MHHVARTTLPSGEGKNSSPVARRVLPGTCLGLQGMLDYINLCVIQVHGSALAHQPPPRCDARSCAHRLPITFTTACLILESASLRYAGTTTSSPLRRHHHVVSATPSPLRHLRYAVSRHTIFRVQGSVAFRSRVAKFEDLSCSLVCLSMQSGLPAGILNICSSIEKRAKEMIDELDSVTKNLGDTHYWTIRHHARTCKAESSSS